MTKVHRIPHKYPVFCDSGIRLTPQVELFIRILDEEYERLINTDDPDFLLSEGSFEPHLKTLAPIPVIVSPETPTREYSMTDRELAEQIIKELGCFSGSRCLGRDTPVDVVEKRIKNRKRQEMITGTYHHEGCPEIITIESEAAYEKEGGPYIKIYYNHFEQEDEKILRVALSNCLAHEYFHYYHDCFATEEFNKSGKGKKSRERVKEALADYFSVVYTWLLAREKYKDHQGSYEYNKYEDYAVDRYHQWERREGSDWPYAYALCFYKVKCKYLGRNDKFHCDDYIGCRVKFQEVLNLSKEDMVKAFEYLKKRNIKDMCDFV